MTAAFMRVFVCLDGIQELVSDPRRQSAKDVESVQNASLTQGCF